MTEIIGVLIAAAKFDGIDFTLMVLAVLALTYLVGSLVEGHQSPRSAPERPPQPPPVPGTREHDFVKVPAVNRSSIFAATVAGVGGFIKTIERDQIAQRDREWEAKHITNHHEHGPLSLSELIALNGTNKDDWSEEDFAAASDVLINVFSGHHFDAWLKRRKPYDWATEDSGLA